MLRPKMFRAIAAMILATGLFLTLTGCGNNKTSGETKVEKKTESNASPPLSINADPNSGTSSDTSVKIVPMPPAIASPVDKPYVGPVKLTVDVTNTGSRAGDAVVQLYVKHLHSKVERPREELEGFQRVTVEAGQTKTVEVALPASRLA